MQRLEKEARGLRWVEWHPKDPEVGRGAIPHFLMQNAREGGHANHAPVGPKGKLWR